MVINQSVEIEGTKTVSVKTIGHENPIFTVIVSCMVLVDGRKVDPLVIFKGKTMPKIKFLARILVHIYEKSLMVEEEIQLWLDDV
jgi:hypothetical protein